MKVYLNQAQELCKQALAANLTPFLHSSPGLGKSSIVKQLAETFNLELIDIRLATLESVDLMGFPKIKKMGETDVATYVPFDWFPCEHTPIPKGKNGFLLFMDEMNASDLSVQKAAYRIILDHEVGNYKLHPKCFKIAAGNLVTDGAAVNRITTALQSRMLHIQVKPDERPAKENSWIQWAMKSGIDSRVTSYLSWKPDNIHQYEPEHNDMTFRTPRTWEFVSGLLQANLIEDVTLDHQPLIESAIGSSGALEFISYCRLFTSLPSIEDIYENPQLPFNSERNISFALTGLLAAALANKMYPDKKPLITFISRMQLEFRIITYQAANSRDSSVLPALMKFPEFKHVIQELGKYL